MSEWVTIAQWHECKKMARPGIVFELKNIEGQTLLTECTPQLPPTPLGWKSPPVLFRAVPLPKPQHSTPMPSAQKVNKAIVRNFSAAPARQYSYAGKYCEWPSLVYDATSDRPFSGLPYRTDYGNRRYCGCSSMVEQQPSKLMTTVRFRSPAPIFSMAYPLAVNWVE